ncbi:hypothetical protein FZF86_02540 [Salmonella enterica]|nr:hypothetical protein [Salmonella enterica]
MAKNEELKKFIFAQIVVYLSSVMADKSNRIPDKAGSQRILSDNFHNVYDWLLAEYEQLVD